MKIIFAFLIFCLVLFIYLHVNYHLKTSDDLEIFEVDDGSKDKLEEIFEMRQPTIFNFDNEKIVQTTNKTYIQNNYNACEIKIRNTADVNSNSELYMPLPLHAATKLFDEDTYYLVASFNNWFPILLERTGKRDLNNKNKQNNYENILKKSLESSFKDDSQIFKEIME